MERFLGSKFVVALTLALALFLVFNFGEAGTVSRSALRKIFKLRHEFVNGTCPTNYICGWEVYDPRTRVRTFPVSSSCTCADTDHCIQTNDNIDIPAYEFRCRVRKNKKKTTTPSPQVLERQSNHFFGY